jgi:hypothetical protein
MPLDRDVDCGIITFAGKFICNRRTSAEVSTFRTLAAARRGLFLFYPLRSSLSLSLSLARSPAPLFLRLGV